MTSEQEETNLSGETGVASDPPTSTSEWKAFETYPTQVDPDQGYKSKTIRVCCNYSRPHMRAFQFAWWCHFVATFVTIAYIRSLWFNIGAIVSSLAIGPLCDAYGARRVFSLTLSTAAVFIVCAALFRSLLAITIFQFLVGLSVGVSFVICQYWTSSMFTKEIVGAANGIAAGWGSLGAAPAGIVGVTALERLWTRKLSMYILAPFVLVTAASVYFFSEDTPKGNLKDLKKHGMIEEEPSILRSFCRGAWKRNTWILAIPYAVTVGTNWATTTLTLFVLRTEFRHTLESANGIVSSAVYFQVFSLGLGGYLSDKFSNQRNNGGGMKNRIWTLILMLLGQAVFAMIGASSSFSQSLCILTSLLSHLFGQFAEGVVYSIVPYVDPKNSGTVIGIVRFVGLLGANCVWLLGVMVGLARSFQLSFVIIGIFPLVAAGVTTLVDIAEETKFWSNQNNSSNNSATTICANSPDVEANEDE